jgi:murein L,D-transpeptidase YafK
MRRAFSALLLLVLTALLVIVFHSSARLHAVTGLRILSAMSIELPYAAPPSAKEWTALPAAERLEDVRRRVKPLLERELASQSLRLGRPVFIRIFKESREFELWVQDEASVWKLFRTYPIATYSGSLGPKLAEGDGQAPEGFYDVVRERLNPASRYHLAFNIGYPNAFDRDHARTGSLIMVHGDRVSIGCFAMTDPVIEEIYLLVAGALENGQRSVPVHSFPFRMTAERMEQAAAEPWSAFWQNLRLGHDYFSRNGRPPAVSVRDGRYEFR